MHFAFAAADGDYAGDCFKMKDGGVELYFYALIRQMRDASLLARLHKIIPALDLAEYARWQAARRPLQTFA